MRARKRPRGVVVGYSADEALEHLHGDTALPVRVRWALDASTAATLHATLTADRTVMATRATFVDSFHGSDDMPALGWWLRRRDSDHAASWCMRVARRVKTRCASDDADSDDHHDHDESNNPGKDDDCDTRATARGNHTASIARDSTDGGVAGAAKVSQPRRRRRHCGVYVHSDIDDDDHLVAMVAPDSGARDLSALCLGLYARVGVSRTTYHLAGVATAPALCVVVDRATLGGSSAGSVALQGTAVVCDAAAAQRLIDVLAAAGVDTGRAPPPSKVAAYLARRRPALYARLVQRGVLAS
nr:hypothetical protein [Pandoravirus belohorizontensis]